MNKSQESIAVIVCRNAISSDLTMLKNKNHDNKYCSSGKLISMLKYQLSWSYFVVYFIAFMA